MTDEPVMPTQTKVDKWKELEEDCLRIRAKYEATVLAKEEKAVAP